MRVPFLTTLALAAILSSPCRGEAVSENVAAPQVTTTPPGAASAQVKVSVVGLLCPTANEAARQQYDWAIDLQRQGKLGEAKEAYPCGRE